MSLRLRLALYMAALVVLTLAVAWGVTGGAVLRPLTHQVFEGYLDQAINVAEQVEQGAHPRRLARELDLRLRHSDQAPYTLHASDRWVVTERRGRAVAWLKGPRNMVAVQTDRGWLVVQRDLDLQRPRRNVGLFLLLLAVGLAGATTWLVWISSRPLIAAQEGMRRIAAGELGHRLQEQGPAELAEAARTFNAMADQVDGMLRRERELMAGISHELRTPLTRLRLELELMRDLEQAPERRLNAMEADLTEIDQMVEELLQVSRMELGQLELKLCAVDLEAMAQQVARSVDLGARELVVTGTPAPDVQADPTLMRRVLRNLLSNVARYTPNQGKVFIELDGHSVTVRDQGPGVPSEELLRLFEPFYRAEGSRSKGTGGLGLGLMIVRQVMQLHGGEVEATNAPAGGLSIRLQLPEIAPDPA